MFTIDDVCTVVVFYNGDEAIIEKIKGYKSFSKHVVIVDNSTNTDCSRSLKEALNEEGEIVLIDNEGNAGIAKALNQGLNKAEELGDKLLLTMDQDSLIERKAVETLVHAIDVENNVISVGPNYQNRQIEEDKEVSFLITSGNLLYIEKVKKIGGFKEELFIDCVDIDLSFNIVASEYRIKLVHDAYMQHAIGEYEESRLLKIKYLSHKPERFFYKYRNNIYIQKKYRKILRKRCLILFVSLCYESLRLIFVERDKIKKIKYALKGIKESRGLCQQL